MAPKLRCSLALVCAQVFSLFLGSRAVLAQDETTSSSISDSVRSQSLRPVRDVARGESLYRVKCALCHGREGRGNGAVARHLDPAPRDLTAAKYKFRSTPTGELPTDDDLFRTISAGFRGTAMPGFSGLSADERWQLVYHVKAFSAAFEDEEPPEPMVIPAPQSVSRAVIRRGQIVFGLMSCDQCHGNDGRGRGPSASTLKDYRNQRMYPFDMTRGWKLKSGTSPSQIYQVLVTGLDGTPMPSYDQSLSESDLWALVHYTRSLFVSGSE